jgi:cytochrome c oxidase assembly protein subunit 11
VPAYRAFCSATGFSGVPVTDPARFNPERLYVDEEAQGRKRITVHFEATASDTLPWTFSPQQRSVRVLPGETALAFYTAKNVGTEDLIGIATYNMTPGKVCRGGGLGRVQADRSADRAVLCQSRVLLL